MRNLQLFNLLQSLAYDRGHANGQNEVDNILFSLVHDFQEIDNMLPLTMPPKFKIGDKLKWIAGYEVEVVEHIERNDGHAYKVSVPALNNTYHYILESHLTPTLKLV